LITVDWIDFLKTGTFGGIRLGMLGQDMKTLLGKEEDHSVRKHPLVLKYGKLEVSLDENRVVSISTHFQTGPGPIWKTVKSMGWTPDLDVSIESFNDVLARQGIRAEVIPYWNHPDAVGFQLECGVSAWFARDGKQSALHGLSIMDKTWGSARAAQRVEEIDGIIDTLKDRKPRRSP